MSLTRVMPGKINTCGMNARFSTSFSDQNNVMRLKLLFSCKQKAGVSRPCSEEFGKLYLKHLSGPKTHALPPNDPTWTLKQMEFFCSVLVLLSGSENWILLHLAWKQI